MLVKFEYEKRKFERKIALLDLQTESCKYFLCKSSKNVRKMLDFNLS